VLATNIKFYMATIRKHSIHGRDLIAPHRSRENGLVGRAESEGSERIVGKNEAGSYRDVLASREGTRLASLGALGVRVATHDPVWHSSVIAITSEPLGETTRLAQFSVDPFLAMNSIPIIAISPWWSTISSTGSIHAEHSQGSRRTDR
jgi:hypothetical protein